MTTFLRLLEDKAKASSLKEVCEALRANSFDGRIFDQEPSSFRAIPGAPFAYWVSAHVRDQFLNHPPFLNDKRRPSFGASTKDDFRYLRAAWEVDRNKIASSRSATVKFKWVSLAKGGSFSKFYAPIHLLVNWFANGAELKADISEYRGVKGWGYQWSAALNGHELYFRPGLTWPRRTNGLSFRVLPEGCIFGDKGPGVFDENDDPESLMALCAIANSQPFGLLVSVQLARIELAQSFEVGLIQQTPVPEIDDQTQRHLAALSRRAWSLKRRLDSANETSSAFLLPAIISELATGYSPSSMIEELEIIEGEIDAIAFDIYNLSAADCTKASEHNSSTLNETAVKNVSFEGEPDDEDGGSLSDHTDSLLSWAVGVAFGRFDWRLATGERSEPSEPGPFDQLPTKSPGMLLDGAEPFHRNAGILVDDLGHPHDLAKCAEDVLERVGLPTPLAARRWLQREFFSLHLKIYSKSKRKAPIYWQIATAWEHYSVWLYAPDVNSDTFFRLQQDFLEPKIANEERALSELSQGGLKLSSRDRLEIEHQQKLVEQLKQLADEVKRVAPLWNPDLNDGTVLVMAPLWRMVGHHKQWQKELRTRWEEVQLGKHDWSYQAMHLWPERVVPKCAEDRSLAIAHDLEGVFWSETEFGKWAKRDVPTRSVDEMVRERTSDAVKAALKELLEAPEPTATGSRLRRRA